MQINQNFNTYSFTHSQISIRKQIRWIFTIIRYFTKEIQQTEICRYHFLLENYTQPNLPHRLLINIHSNETHFNIEYPIFA